jgi:hypothetical protein
MSVRGEAIFLRCVSQKTVLLIRFHLKNQYSRSTQSPSRAVVHHEREMRLWIKVKDALPLRKPNLPSLGLFITVVGNGGYSPYFRHCLYTLICRRRTGIGMLCHSHSAGTCTSLSPFHRRSFPSIPVEFRIALSLKDHEENGSSAKRIYHGRRTEKIKCRPPQKESQKIRTAKPTDNDPFLLYGAWLSTADSRGDATLTRGSPLCVQKDARDERPDK